MADDTLTARNRINQRNFRARRQNYIKDLEERLRKYESEGVQATIEIQTAARQVTEQNVKLRALLMSRLGMNDHEIETYLNTHGPPVSIHPNLLPVALVANPGGKSTSDHNGFSLLPAPPTTISNGQQIQSASVLSPALGLASLHKASDSFGGSEPPTKKQRRDLTTQMSISVLTSSEEGRKRASASTNGHSNGYYSPSSTQDRLSNDQDPDTLSESSNPRTPADSLDPLLRTTSNTQSIHPMTGHESKFDTPPSMDTQQNEQIAYTSITGLAADVAAQHGQAVGNGVSKGKKLHPPVDETACEDAARIIASMRGTNDRPEQILLELGCSPTKDTESCKVKNLSIFSLVDRA